MRGVITSPTRELTTPEKATPIMIPMAKSTTLPRKIKDLKPLNTPTVAFSALCTFGLPKKAMIVFLLLCFKFTLTFTHSSSGWPAARLEKREGRGHLALRQGTVPPAPPFLSGCQVYSLFKLSRY